LNLPRAELQRLGLVLGADVPVFVFGRSAFAEGVGEVLQAVELAPAWYVVLVPPVHVSTPEIFADRELTRNTIPIRIADFSTGQGHNDLEPVVCRKHPPVAEYLGWLKGFGDARMTGSGACVFAAFATREEAQRVLDARPESMQGFVAAGLDRHPLYEFAS
jgi:4-diphosphocytidyl-2-C-methyl-D-erythritol kinase